MEKMEERLSQLRERENSPEAGRKVPSAQPAHGSQLAVSPGCMVLPGVSWGQFLSWAQDGQL